MSSYTKSGSEIFVEDKDTVQFSPETASNHYGLMVADSSARLGFKIALCSACQGEPVDLSNDDLGLTISMDLHTIEHAWFEKYAPTSNADYERVRSLFVASLTDEMQAFEIARQIRLEEGLKHIASVQEGDN